MSKLFKWLGIAVGLAAIVVIAIAATGWLQAGRKLERRIDVSVAALALPTEAAALERGRYLFNSRGCAECHGANGGGHKVIDSGGLLVVAPHISPGPGSVTAAYRVEDWVRAIRHGLKTDGRPLMIMPSEDYNRLTDTDLGALIAYARQLPAVSGETAVIQLPPPVRVLYGLGLIQDAAAKIDHSLAPPAPVPEGPTVAHGRYVAQMCIGCHGEGYGGGKIPGGPPDWPAAANLTPGAGSAMAARYAGVDAFVAMMRSGTRPDGSPIAVMPFQSLAQMNDVDLRGLHAFLQSLPPRAQGSR
ncbi:mono/diheme cytochrome c family protein [Pelomonas saccharophila]|uniref:Mono/diheme cytochrome c family protein n=1 Tax=Roseateles saccharophilus TaxID=304 RepID=A0ABU1YKY5_ROSSA|nr:cytochrome c [Roseateles saccharophilus]MDR7269520.1 mono/diheme cytochrome c family protein [Roseateles saccharophilus]